MIRRIDPVARGAFGLLCIAGLLLEAIPVLVAVGVLGGLGILIIGNVDRALWVWVGSWIAAGLSAAMFLALAYFFWPLASDWITEWQGYVMALIIGASGLVAMALTVKFTDWPLAIELLVPLGLTFLVGFATPGWLLGLGPHLQTMGHRQYRSTRKPGAP